MSTTTPDAFVFVTQIVDPDDPVLGVICNSMAALAQRTELTVIANTVVRVPDALGANARVVSLGKERAAHRLSRGLAYQRALWHAVHDGRARGLLAHMCPTYLVQAAPIARAHKVTTMLWFAHWRDSRLLAAAERLSDVVLTSLPGAYPRATQKLAIIGQAIAVDRYASIEPASWQPGTGPIELVAIGRTSPAKRFDLVIDALATVRARGIDARLRIVGPSTTEAENTHRAELHARIDAAGLAEHASVEGPRSPDDLVAVLADAHILVNATATGTGDKTVFEAMAAARPVVVSNPAFADLVAGLPLDLRFTEGSEAQLVDRVVALAAAPRQTWIDTATTLRARVRAEHSVDHWADAVLAAVSTSGAGSRS